MEHRRSMMQGGAFTPLKNGLREFDHGNQLKVTEGHYVRLVHPSVNYALIVNISDLSYNGNEAASQDNNNSTAEWLRLKKGDVVYFRFTITALTHNGNNTVNFTTRKAGGATIETLFGNFTLNNVQVGTVKEHTYIPYEDITIASLCTWHSYSGSSSFDITWNVEIYVNGKRAV